MMLMEAVEDLKLYMVEHDCSASLFKECLQYYGHKGDPRVAPLVRGPK